VESCTGCGGAGGSLQGSYDSGATIETASNVAVVITETSAAANTGDLLQLTANAATGGTFSGDALQITMDAVDANGYTGNGLRIVVDQSQNTGSPILIEDDAGVDLLAVSETGGLTVGSAANGRSDINVYGDLITKGYNVRKSLANIIDLFVYDTTRDSDRGHWRTSLNVQGTSWYTETKDDGPSDACVIATDDRCGSSEFPRTAIIATTADGVYIFDAKDNSLWMKFTQAGTYALGADTNNNPSGVSAVNGVVYVGTNGASATGMYAFDFAQDKMYRYNATNRVEADTTIGTRNSATSYAGDPITALAILNATVNDVSAALMNAGADAFANVVTLLTDAGAGPVKGLVKIAVANDSGVSVVSPVEQKVFNYSDVANDDYNTVFLTSRGRMYAANETQAQLESWRNVDRDNTSEVAGTPDKIYDEVVGRAPITNGVAPTILTSPATLAVVERASGALESAAAGVVDVGDLVYFGTNQGFVEIQDSGGSTVGANADGWTKITTTGTSTPWMHGPVRSVFLFDEVTGSTDAVSAVGGAGTGANNRLDAANATNPTFSGNGGVRGGSVNFNNNSYFCSDANNDGTCDNDTDYNVAAISFTISLWFKHSTTAAADTLFEKCFVPATGVAAGACVAAGMNASGQITFGIDDDTTWATGSTTVAMDDAITSTNTFNDGRWHHAIFTNTDTDICMYIDGRQAVACDSTLAATATLDTGSATLTIGGQCSAAACATGVAFWDGEVDDFVWSSNLNTTIGGMNAEAARKLYLSSAQEREVRMASTTDATTFSSNTIGDSGESWRVNEFTGRMVTIVDGTGIGQTRRVISNTATVLTVFPNWTVTPDATSDFKVDPSRLYGYSDNVTSVAVDLPQALNTQRNSVYVGTSNGSDGGGVTVFTNNLVTDYYHTDAGLSSDDFGTAWSGTDADDIQAIAAYNGTIAIGSLATINVVKQDKSFEQTRLETIGALNGIQTELISKHLFGSSMESFGVGAGADLAEYYSSTQPLERGEIVTLDPTNPHAVLRATKPYQSEALGVIATQPGIILGPYVDTSFPVALVGRVPVKVTTENGVIKSGDRVTSATLSGYGMRATKSGRVIGVALEDAKIDDFFECPDDPQGVAERRCGQVMVFVNLVDYNGESIDMLLSEIEEGVDFVSADITATTTATSTTSTLDQETELDKDVRVIKLLKSINVTGQIDAEILTDRLSAAFEIYSPRIITEGLRVDYVSALFEEIGFKSDVVFFGRPYFTTDTAGFALVKAGDIRVDVVFDREYLETPVINASMSSKDGLSSVNQSVAIQAFFGKDIKFLITNATTTGFTIYLNKPVDEDVSFNWIALAVKSAKMFESSGSSTPVNVVDEDQSPVQEDEPVVGETNDLMEESTPVNVGDSSTTTPEILPLNEVPVATEDSTTPPVEELAPEEVVVVDVPVTEESIIELPVAADEPQQ